MCWWKFKKKQSGELPTLPSLTVDEVVDELEYDIQIHESYAGLVVQNPSHYPPSVYGDYD